jgi:hypothetical protein
VDLALGWRPDGFADGGGDSGNVKSLCLNVMHGPCRINSQPNIVCLKVFKFSAELPFSLSCEVPISFTNSQSDGFALETRHVGACVSVQNNIRKK